MFKSIFTIIPLLSALSTFVNADVTPTSPDGSTVVRVGQTAEALWTKDPQGNWTDITIKLMTGDNYNMVEVTTLAENVDGTTADSLEWTVPDVSPNSKIYFLQFTPDAITTPQWTTRFTIAAADGSTTDPTNSTQPGTGAAIPWGTGMLVSGGNSTSASTSSNSTMGESSFSFSASLTSSSMMSSTSAQATMTTSMRSAASESASSAASSVSRSASAASAAATNNTSGAVSVQVASGVVALVGFMAGFMVL